MVIKGMFKNIGDRIPLSQKVASKIEEAILSKELSVGDKLPSEHELCDQFGVSRTSVREAVKILITQGIVEVEKGRGIFVKNLSSQSVTDGILKFYKHRLDGAYAVDLVHTRQAIEPSIAFYAALNRTKEDIKILKKDIELIEANKNNAEMNTKFDMAFHVDLAQASKNKIFLLTLKPLYQLIPPMKFDVVSKIPEANNLAREWHIKIFEAVKKQDANEARKAMEKHLVYAEEHMNIILKYKKKD